MLNDYNRYMEALTSQQIRTHKDALQYFNVRYSSFAQNYPLDSSLPACTLAEHGFHYDNNTRTLKCFSCDYTSHDLYDDLLCSLLNKHLKASSQCPQAQASLRHTLHVENDAESKLPKPNDPQLVLNRAYSTWATAVKAENKQYANEEARFKSFENEKLIIDVRKLAATGLYKVNRLDVLAFKDQSGWSLNNYIKIILY